LIDDIIEFVDNEEEEGVIIFVDQQKAFDRMEWGWLGVFRIAQAIGPA
jgi:hypothetical protein